MKITIVTVCYNSEEYLEDAILSVNSQDYRNFEYIIVDGNSTDGTVDIIKSHQDKIDRWVSEPDNGIYEAMNKGIKMASGDIIGILNSDDLYTHSDILSKVASSFSGTTEAVFGDVFFVNPGNMDKPVRNYSAQTWNPKKFAWGFMPPHPSFFVKKEHYENLGLYRTDYAIASDYELLIRFLYVNRLTYRYLPIKMVKMRTGGASTKNLNSTLVLNSEILRACRENGLATNFLKLYLKYFKKVFELIW